MCACKTDVHKHDRKYHLIINGSKPKQYIGFKPETGLFFSPEKVVWIGGADDTTKLPAQRPFTRLSTVVNKTTYYMGMPLLDEKGQVQSVPIGTDPATAASWRFSDTNVACLVHNMTTGKDTYVVMVVQCTADNVPKTLGFVASDSCIDNISSHIPNVLAKEIIVDFDTKWMFGILPAVLVIALIVWWIKSRKSRAVTPGAYSELGSVQ